MARMRCSPLLALQRVASSCQREHIWPRPHPVRSPPLSVREHHTVRRSLVTSFLQSAGRSRTKSVLSIVSLMMDKTRLY